MGVSRNTPCWRWFPIRPAVLPFQGVGTERHGFKGRKPFRGNLSGMGRSLNESKPFRWHVELLLRSENQCVTVTWIGKDTSLLVVPESGIRRQELYLGSSKEQENYPLCKERMPKTCKQGKEYRQRSRGGLTRSSDLCQISPVKQGWAKGFNGLKAIYQPRLSGDEFVSACSAKMRDVSRRACDGDIKHVPWEVLGWNRPFTYSTVGPAMKSGHFKYRNIPESGKSSWNDSS